MARHCFIIEGKKDEELTTAGLWFALTYLYAVNIDPTEKRYALAGNTDIRIQAIQTASQVQIRDWLAHTLKGIKNIPNSGKVTRSEQYHFAKELNKLHSIKTE